MNDSYKQPILVEIMYKSVYRNRVTSYHTFSR